MQLRSGSGGDKAACFLGVWGGAGGEGDTQVTAADAASWHGPGPSHAMPPCVAHQGPAMQFHHVRCGSGPSDALPLCVAHQGLAMQCHHVRLIRAQPCNATMCGSSAHPPAGRPYQSPWTFPPRSYQLINPVRLCPTHTGTPYSPPLHPPTLIVGRPPSVPPPTYLITLLISVPGVAGQPCPGLRSHTAKSLHVVFWGEGAGG